MALRGQRFTLDPDAENFTFNVAENPERLELPDAADFVKEIKERDPAGIPPPPQPGRSKTGFPQHRYRGNPSVKKTKQNPIDTSPAYQGPSDRAVVNHLSQKYGIIADRSEKQKISNENRERIARMSPADIEEARAELMANMSPALMEKFLRRANIDEDTEHREWDEKRTTQTTGLKTTSTGVEVDKDNSPDESDTLLKIHLPEPQFQETVPSMHFPAPPRNPDGYIPLDPDAPSFLSDLKQHYFPELPEDTSGLAWLQDPTQEESMASPYAPTQTSYAPSDIRFDFTGRLLGPNESREISVSKGLHHHGEAPESAGYTIPELSILVRSALPNQRCIAYQILGRILFRLGRGDFGPRGSNLQEGLWSCVERERPIEVMMSEANRTGGHISAKAYATEALWLWRKGGGGERGVLKAGERLAK